MDIILNTLRQALVETRTDVAGGFSALVNLSDQKQFSGFVLRYCHQAAILMEWLFKWNKECLNESSISLDEEAMGAFQQIQSRLLARQKALLFDEKQCREWMVGEGYLDPSFEHEGKNTAPGLKQLRHVQQLCLRRRDCSTWLCVLSEIERLRMIHGFTFIKLCELNFGKAFLKKLSHVHAQHQQITALFDLIEAVLRHTLVQQPLLSEQSLEEMRLAIKGYGVYITNCYNLTEEAIG